MSHNSQVARRQRRGILSAGLIAIATLLSTSLHGQTTSTGALAGVSLDPSGAELPGVLLRLSNRETGRSKSAISDEHGRFSFLLLRPGTYQLQASKTEFRRRGR
jgi:Carboxypeptidase regulatory-like domain